MGLRGHFKQLSLVLLFIFNIFLLAGGITSLVKGYHYSKKAIQVIKKSGENIMDTIILRTMAENKTVKKYVRYLFLTPGSLVVFVAACGLSGPIKHILFWLYSMCMLSSIGGIIYQFSQGEWRTVGSLFMLTSLDYLGLEPLKPVTELIIEILALLLTLFYLYCRYNEVKRSKATAGTGVPSP